MTTNQEAIRYFARAMRDTTGNLPPLPGIFPDYAAPIIRNTPEGRELAMVRWGMPTPISILHKAADARAEKPAAKSKPFDLVAMRYLEPDAGVTNVRNVKSPHWRRWLRVPSRCVVPFTSFSEWDASIKAPASFALDDSRPLAFFAGIWTPAWTSVRKSRTGVEKADLFACPTTEPNAVVGPIHPGGDASDPDDAGQSRR